MTACESGRQPGDATGPGQLLLDIVPRNEPGTLERPVVSGVDETAASGIFDPSITVGPINKLWMACSIVVPSEEYGSVFNGISSRLAYSNDTGQDWVDTGFD